MKKKPQIFIFVVVFVLAVSFALGLLGFWYGIQDSGNGYVDNETSSEIVDTFRDELTTRGVEAVGQPIEGFNAFMLLEAFPGLDERDFHKVGTGLGSEEGVYLYTNGELRWKRTGDMPVTSGERTIFGEEYETLLSNVSERLGQSVSNRQEAIEIVDMLSLPSVDD